MNCSICNVDMFWGNIYLKGNAVGLLTGDREENLFFEEFDPKAKLVQLIKWGNYCEGFYCDNCGYVCLNNRNSNMKCTHCQGHMVVGSFHMRKSSVGKFVRNTPNHLYFTSKVDERTLKILDGDFYVRGFYCKTCGNVWFNSEQSKPNH